MSNQVWVTDAMRDTAMVRHFNPPADYYSDLDRTGKTESKLYSGAAIDREELPSEDLVLERVVGPIDPLPHFITNSYVLVSKPLKELLCEFNLGATQFFPVALYGLRKEKVLGPEYFYLNVAERKGAFEPGQSSVKASPLVPDSYSANLLRTTTEVAVNSSAFDGVDLWMEASLRGTMFLSDRLMTTIRQSGFMPTARFQKCKIV